MPSAAHSESSHERARSSRADSQYTEEPSEHWWITSTSTGAGSGSRPAMYFYRRPGSEPSLDQQGAGTAIELKLANRIRTTMELLRYCGRMGGSTGCSSLRNRLEELKPQAGGRQPVPHARPSSRRTLGPTSLAATCWSTKLARVRAEDRPGRGSVGQGPSCRAGSPHRGAYPHRRKDNEGTWTALSDPKDLERQVAIGLVEVPRGTPGLAKEFQVRVRRKRSVTSRATPD